MRLKIKEWIAKVTEFIDTQKESVTSGSVVLNCYRRGHIVTLQSYINFPSANDGQIIGTVPEGFRPWVNVDFTVFNTSGTRLGVIRIKWDGTIQVAFGNMTAGTVRDTFTFIGGGVLFSSIFKAFRHRFISEGVAA